MVEYGMHSPVGPLQLREENGALTGLSFGGAVTAGDAPTALLQEVRRQLEAYFSGAQQTFTVQVRLGGTPFQHAVWQALREIPWGETWTYGDIARKIGRPRAVRAVGQAIGKNPIGIIVPCHRVIGKNGTLTGFAGGLEIKEQLLKLEGSR